jgi:hypothetical protein
MSPIEVLQHPDQVCESEYRAIYECLGDALADTPESERKTMALAMLREFEEWAKSLRRRIRKIS